MGTRHKARENALQMMFQYDVTGEGNAFIGRYWIENPAVPEVKEFASGLVSGTISRISEIDAVIGKYAENWSLSRMSRVDRNILRLAVYELFWVEDVPAKVTLNESITIAQKFSDEESGAFINGILDRVLRTEKSLKKKLEENDLLPVIARKGSRKPSGGTR